MYTQEKVVQPLVSHPQGLLTLEIRWFQNGPLPLNVQHWFEAECPGQLSAREKRCDRYLHTPGCETINIKLREGDLEVKRCLGPLLEPMNGHTTALPITVWSGQSERWLKWVYPFNSFQLQESPTGESLWTDVLKTRWQRRYLDITVGLTLLNVEQMQWWTLAFEGQPQTENPDRWFSQQVDAVNATYRGPALLADQSYGYPVWFSQLSNGTR
ncbi:MAG: hypothetical protein WA902_21995 [Thermosynechococcaceae cyanobacterium]